MLARIGSFTTPDIIFISGGLVPRDMNTNEDYVIANFSATLDIVKARFPSS